MDANWIRAGFFIFVLAPLWALLLMFVVDVLIKNETLKASLETLLGFAAMQAFIWDMIFLFLWVLDPVGSHQIFTTVWFWLFGGTGIIWWWCSLAGYILATIVSVFNQETDMYIKECFGYTAVSLLIYFVIVFLSSVANSLVISQ